MFLTHTNELKILEFSDADINPTKNYQYNGSTPPLVTHPYPLYSPLEDTSVAPDEPPPGPHIEAGDSAIQVCTGDLPYVRLLGADDMLLGVYQDFMQKIKENIWMAESQRMDIAELSEKNRLYTEPMLRPTVWES